MAANPSNGNYPTSLKFYLPYYSQFHRHSRVSQAWHCSLRNYLFSGPFSFRSLLPEFTPLASLNTSGHQFLAGIGPSAGLGSTWKKSERCSVKKVSGDGRCMFRALVKGMALNKGVALGPREEREGADEVRMAVKEVIRDNAKERVQFEEALVAITVEEPLRRPDFWGGEAELLVLSRLCSQPIVVYVPENELGGYGSGFVPIQEYGSELRKGKSRKVVRLLYTG